MKDLRAGGACAALGTLLALGLAGCGTVRYYAQSVEGQLSLLAAREPIVEVLARADTPPAIKRKLALALQAREFAASALELPDNDSYRSYSALDRPYVVWNVFAAPELSLEPTEWCFLIVGCVPYRGYFAEQDARRYATKLSGDGLDTFVGGVAAYSTLGWFDDPVISTMLNWEDSRLVKMIFHELAHQKIYVPGDTAFNEAFAQFVADEGMRRWQDARGNTDTAAEYSRFEARERAIIELVLEIRTRLATLYASGTDEREKRARKAEIFVDMQSRYQAMRKEYGYTRGYDLWMTQDLNNAKIASVVTYQDLVPAFARLFADAHGDLKLFYAKVVDLGDMTPRERQTELGHLATPRTGSPGGLSDAGTSTSSR